MNKISILFSIIFFLILIQVSFATPNPAAVYCKELGYEYKIIETSKGQKGICTLPNKQECGEWDFFEGLCGKEYSYCVKNGYDIETAKDGKNSFSPEYAVCVPKKPGLEKKSVTDLMNFKEKLSKYEINVGKITETSSKVITTEIKKLTTTTTINGTKTLKRVQTEILNFFSFILDKFFRFNKT